MAKPVLLVTGGSRGIGAATAECAARQGYRVVVNYHSRADAAAVVVDRIQAAGGEAVAMAADVGDPDAVARLFQRIDALWGPVAALVNNAGITIGRRPFMEMTIPQMRQVMDTNLDGVFYCLWQAVARMARSRGGMGGAIVNVSSEAGKFGGNCISAYAAAKAGVTTLTVALARELAPEGIRINAVSPGVIDTEPVYDPDPQKRAALAASLPMGRLGTPEEVAETILWLLSDKAAYVAGAVVTVAGGR